MGFKQKLFLVYFSKILPIKLFAQHTVQKITAKIFKNYQPLFDRRHYLSNNPDVAKSGVDPLSHFLAFGQHEGRTPKLFIYPTWIKSNYSSPDESFADTLKRVYLDSSSKLNPFFDQHFYAMQTGIDKNLPSQVIFDHFVKYGLKYGFNPNPWLDLEFFLKQNPNLANQVADRTEAFYFIAELFNSGKIFDKDVCLAIKVKKDLYLQIDSIIIKLLQTKFIDKKIIDPNVSPWDLINYINNSYTNHFKELEATLHATGYPTSITDRIINHDNLKARNILFYCHWSYDGKVDPWITKVLSFFNKQNYGIVFITNCDIKKISNDIFDLCLAITQRSNVGYDFHSYVASWQELKTQFFQIDNLIVMNDSVFFPVGPTQRLVHALEQNKNEIWGMSKSFSPREHLQSYFISIPGDLVKSYFNWVKEKIDSWIYLGRSGVINNIEILISEFCEENNVFFKALFDPQITDLENPTHEHFAEMLTSGIPILKVDLVIKKQSFPIFSEHFFDNFVSVCNSDMNVHFDEVISHANKINSIRSQKA